MTNDLHSIEFAVRRRSDLQVHELVPILDGRSLLDLVDRFELDSGMDPAGGAYGGLIPLYFRHGPLDEYFLGAASPGLSTKTAVLSCECGEVGCWPLMASIKPTGSLVVWDAFEQIYRPTRDYTTFGPFVFDRVQYDQALEKLCAQYAATEDH